VSVGRSPNGVQPVEAEVHNHSAGSSHEPMEVSSLTHHSQQSYGFTSHGRHNRQQQPTSLASPSSQLSNSLPREDQESLLHAHFSSSSATPLPGSHVHACSGESHPHTSTGSESGASRHQQGSAHLQQQPGSLQEGVAGNHAHGSNFLSTFTQLPPQASSESLPILAPPSIGLAILPTSRGPVEYGNLMTGAPPAGETSVHEVTQVTHSIQAPISSLTPLPNEGGCG